MTATATTSAVDLRAQALKAIAERCPYDSEEFAARAPTLPFGVAAHLSRHADGRRKFKKSASASASAPAPTAEPPPETAPPAPKQAKAPRLWEEVEVYFRPVTESDIERLRHGGLLDSCFSIPVVTFRGNEVAVSSEVAKEEELESDEREAGEVEQPMEIDSVEKVSTSTSALPATDAVDKEETEEDKDEEEKEGLSVHWVLGSKHRAVLTTQRPTKKRKLLGTDAGLDQLMVLPHSGEDSLRCDVCSLGESTGSKNRIVTCSLCKALVHKKCYGLHGAVMEPWVCSWCEQLEGMLDEERRNQAGLKPCVLCPKEVGAFKPVRGDHTHDEEKKFAHLFCSIWTPEVYVEDTSKMEPVINVGGIPEMRTRLVCNVCKVKHGVCVRCSYGTCRAAFHPICAREARHQLEIWGKFGCDNVELRAFCSKHSEPKLSGNGQLTRNLNHIVANDSSVAKPPLVTIPQGKLPKLRLTRKNKEKDTPKAEITCSISNEMLKTEVSRGAEADEMKQSINTDGEITESLNSLQDISDLIPFVKKLISRGKIIISDVASKMGVSSDSLEAALMGEVSSIPAELKLKISKWFQEYLYVDIPSYKRHLKFRNGSAISSGSLAARVDCPNANGVTSLDIADSCKLPDSNRSETLVKSSTHKEANNNPQDLCEDKTICSSGEQYQQNSDKEHVHQSGEGLVGLTDDIKECAAGGTSPIHDQSQKIHLKMITEDASTSPNSCLPVLPPDLEGNSIADEKHDIFDAQHLPECEVDNASTKSPDNIRVDEGNVHQDGILYKDRIGGCPTSYVHPYIRERLMHIPKALFSKCEFRGSSCSGPHEDGETTRASDLCNHREGDVNPAVDPSQLDRLPEAKRSRILEVEDEVEGEMLYYQSKLLDNALATKCNFENLLGKIVEKLPQELDALKKQRWDSVLVNQYLREVREAKKRGRKERRHREAQAVLAAAAAAAAASSRNPLLRKDGNDEISSPHQESPQKVSVPTGRAAGQSPLWPRLKETPRSSIAKVSQEKHSGISHLSASSKEDALFCDICRQSETLLNRIFVCSSCKVPVHLDCYRKTKDHIGPWKCELCEEISESGSPRNQTVASRGVSYSGIECGLCGGSTGAFRKTTNGQWVHAFCAEWLMESTFRRGQQNLVDGMDVISKEKDLFTCCVCQQKLGVCSKCSYGHCQVTFHPSCARAAGFYMNIKIIGGRLHHKSYCERHSVEQRQKVDTQQCGADELKSIRHLRIELEKVRILCERIVKREKIKRELVVCSHEILAARREYVAFSMLARSAFCASGISSESATTSIDNKSYSGTIQRSEDITVDSKVSGKRTIRLSLDTDRKTDDSSTSQPSLKRKIADRTSYSGKQLPKRSQSISFQNLADGGEKRFKTRKHPETFHKEVVMTSHQASMQNQRLPKGFAYVPIDCVTKEEPVFHDSKPHEPEEPGG